jgi:hypothetical protein
MPDPWGRLVPMSDLDEECKHGLTVRTCTICSGNDATPPRSGSRRSGTPEVLDTPESVEKYRSRYRGEREATFDAYVDVFFTFPDASKFPGGWTMFSRCANAEPALVTGQSALVHRAEELMLLAGYVADDSGRPSLGRRWIKVK